MAPAADVIPPSLPPSVEEAYRRKCVQLKRRMNDVDEATATATVRLIRLRRGVEKLRLERAFLLEQLHRTLKTNNAVEGSEGTPSPPPTPKEKPLRSKKGHRKPDSSRDADNANGGLTTFATTTPHQSYGPEDQIAEGYSRQSNAYQTISFTPANRSTANGNGSVHQRLSNPQNPYELFRFEIAHRLPPDIDPAELEERTAAEYSLLNDARLQELNEAFREYLDATAAQNANDATMQGDEDMNDNPTPAT